MSQPVENITIADSGTRSQFGTGAVRDGQTGKGRFDLLPFEALWEVSKVFEAGAAKYAERNWEKGIPLHVFVSSGLRHLTKWLMGRTDEPHLTMCVWNFLCLLQTKLWIESGRLGTDLNQLPTATVGVSGEYVTTIERFRNNVTSNSTEDTVEYTTNLFDYGPF